jgi:hypothetical protein
MAYFKLAKSIVHFWKKQIKEAHIIIGYLLLSYLHFVKVRFEKSLTSTMTFFIELSFDWLF